jgi:hypothetical protein
MIVSFWKFIGFGLKSASSLSVVMPFDNLGVKLLSAMSYRASS